MTYIWIWGFFIHHQLCRCGLCSELLVYEFWNLKAHLRRSHNLDTVSYSKQFLVRQKVAAAPARINPVIPKKASVPAVTKSLDQTVIISNKCEKPTGSNTSDIDKSQSDKHPRINRINERMVTKENANYQMVNDGDSVDDNSAGMFILQLSIYFIEKNTTNMDPHFFKDIIMFLSLLRRGMYYAKGT